MNREALYEFIDSKAIREHLIKINYELKPIEAALVVWQSDEKTLKEKHEAYNWIIHNMEDAKFENRYIKPGMRLHKLLAKYLEIENKLLDNIMRDGDDAVYICSEYWQGDADMFEHEGVFKSYNDLVNAIREDKYDSAWIRKKWISKDNKQPKTISVLIRSDEEIININQFKYLSNEDEDIYDIFENNVWIDIPIPFKKGDILFFEQGKCYPPHHGPMVFDHLMQWDMDPERFKRNVNCWCIIDMTAFGYFLSGSNIYYECMHNYLKLDYYMGDLDNENRILKALSNYFKGEVPIDLLMEAYHIIKNEEQLKNDSQYMNFLDEAMEMAGLK